MAWSKDHKDKGTVDIDKPDMNPIVLDVNKNLLRKILADMPGEIYRMGSKPRGRAVLVNIEHFDKLPHKERQGSSVDIDNLKCLFKALSFEVEIWQSPTEEKLKTDIEKEANLDNHSDADIFVFVILSHGFERKICTRDYDRDEKGRPKQGFLDIDKDIYEHFDGKKCVKLRGKPKMFFIQACRGVQRTSGYPKKDDGSVETDRMSIQEEEEVAPSYVHEKADMLEVYSTVPEYVSYRDPNQGTWFVRCIVEVFAEDAHKEDVLSMVTRANKLLHDRCTEGKGRQIGVSHNSLRKKIFLLPGYFESSSSKIKQETDYSEKESSSSKTKQETDYSEKESSSSKIKQETDYSEKGREVWVIGGDQGGLTGHDAIQRLGVARGEVSPLPSSLRLPWKVRDHCAAYHPGTQHLVVVGGDVLIGGKWRFDQACVLDVLTGQSSDLPHLSTNRVKPCGFVLGDRMYVAAGEDGPGGRQLNTVESICVSQPESAWQPAPSLPPHTGGEGMAACVSNKSVFLSGGAVSRSCMITWQQGWEQWQNRADMNNPRKYHAMACDGHDKVWVLGGYEEVSMEEYDIFTNQWTNLPSLPHPRYLTGTVFCAGGIILPGGRGPNNEEERGKMRSSVFVYNVREKIWSCSSVHLENPVSYCAVTLV